MSPESDNEDVVRRFCAAFAQRDIDQLVGYFTPQAVYHNIPFPPAVGTQAIRATVPLSTMFGYATHMRGATQGRANYSMQFKQYEEAPKSVSEEIIAKVQGKDGKDK